MGRYRPVWLNMDLHATNTTVEMDCAPGSHATINSKYITKFGSIVVVMYCICSHYLIQYSVFDLVLYKSETL